MAYTKLEAINEILTSVGESAVLTYVQGASDVVNAETVLDLETRAVLSTGWECNTDEDFELVPDSDGRIAVPADALVVDPVDPYQRITMRKGYLWDKEKHTDVIGKPVRCRVVRDMAFEEVPYHVQRRIVAQAVVRYQNSYVGSPTLDKAAQANLAAADAQAQDIEADVDDYNILDNVDIAWHRRWTVRGL